jgi:hypothetical protein
MTLRGDITDFPLTEIVQIIGASRQNGTLVLDGEISKLSIRFRNGKPVQTESADNREKIGEILLKNNELDRRDVIDAILIQKRYSENGDNKRIGNILIEMGTVSPRIIDKYLSDQIIESMYEILSEKKGTFRFETEETNPDAKETITLNIEELILQGLRQIEERAKIKDTLLTPEAVFQPDIDIVDRDGRLLTNDERLVLSLVNGSRPVKEIFKILDIPKLEVTQTLYKLINMSYIQIDAKTTHN